MHIPVVNHSALWRDLNSALLLSHRSRPIFAVTHQLQVSQPEKYSPSPQQRHTRHDQQALCRFLTTVILNSSLSHGSQIAQRACLKSVAEH